jgi:K+-sensing histidine kinase KdpD
LIFGVKPNLDIPVFQMLSAMLRHKLANLTLALNERQGLVITASSLLLVFIGILDYVTGYEFGFFIFYFLPVAIVSWFTDRRTGLFTACVAALFWYLSDLLSHHPYSRAYLIYWETFMRFVSFITTSLTLSRIRQIGMEQIRLEESLSIVLEENELLRSQIRMQTDLTSDQSKAD